MPGRVEPELCQPSVYWPVMAVLHALEILPHFFGLPTRIVGEVGNVLPVRSIRTNQNHGIVSRATTQGASSRIINPISRLVLELRNIVGGKLLLNPAPITTAKDVT